ncbi:DUF4349 domain-containing protein [Flavobacterium sp. P21]|uniref:DUF4349 domain-containing protein n=1 Tax=Flavobacterium sp. P21 TaxID=3423948 RepID=UPI003D669510
MNDIVEAENTLDNKREEKDNSTIENLSLQDQVNFSTITLRLYQNETIRQEVMASEKDSVAYKPNLGIQTIDALKSGWYILESILIFFINIWPIILISIGGFFLYRKYIKK